jgi:predicted metal-dependent hydrolase
MMPQPETGAVTFGATTVPYVIVRSRRRLKTMSISLHPEHGVRVAVPARTASWVVRAFVEKRARWIVRAASEAKQRPAPLRFVAGEALPYLGEQLQILREPFDAAQDRLRDERRRVTVALEGGVFRIAVPDGLDGAARRDAVHRAVAGWYRERAQEHLAGRAALWGRRLGYSATKVLTRDQRSRWGSCSPDGTLRFNWRLIMAAPELIDYVVVHELTHIRVRNHSTEFWAELAKTMPDHRSHRSRLREFGSQLVF